MSECEGAQFPTSTYCAMPKPYIYTYLFASETDRIPVGYFRKQKKKYVRAVLHDLRHTAHYIYVLLENLPNNRFAIIRTEDYRHEIGVNKYWGGYESYSLRQFLYHYKLFHPKDVFQIRFGGEMLYYEQEFTPATFNELYKDVLKSFCKQGLRNNEPICLTDELIREYRLSKADANSARQAVEQCNAEVIAAIQIEYDALKILDCIIK